jgi:Holliday junction resolvasome RuvABC DNA-binding subunit
MADNKLELIVTVDTDKANASIKSVNAGLSSIESTAVNAARGASRGIDGMTAAIVKGATAGNLLADAIERALGWVKEFTAGSVMMAAQNAKAEAGVRAMAQAHGVSAAAAARHVEAIEQIGFEYNEAAQAVKRFLIADLDLSKAEGLAKLAKDAAAIQNVAAGEALETIIMAIESGYARGLRSLGLFVNFEREALAEQLRLGRALTEAEEKQLRYNVIMREGAKIQGAHAAVMQTAAGQLGALRREFQNLREQIGARFQSDLVALLGHLRELVSWLRDNADGLVKLAQAVAAVGTAFAAYKLAEKILALAKSIAALNLATLNPYALLGVAAVGAGLAVYAQWKRGQEEVEARFGEMERRALRLQLLAGKVSLDELRRRGMTDEQLRELVAGRRALPGEESFEVPGPKVRLEATPDLESLKRAAEIRKRQIEAVRATRESALAAEAEALQGPARVVLELQREAQRLTTFVDEHGAMHQFTLLAEARHNLERELQAKLRGLQKETIEETLKHYREEYEQRLAWETELYQRRLDYQEDAARRALEHTEQVYSFELERAGWVRDAQLRQAEAADAQTLEQKLALEQRKAAIEIEYLERVHEIKQRLFDLETSRMVLEEEANLRRLGYRADEIQARIAELTQQREEIRRQQQEATDAAIQAARENAAIRQAELIRDHNRQIFESLKRQAEGVFDALLTRSQSVFAAIGNALKTAVLTAIKEIVTSRVAAMLMELFAGLRIPVAGAAGRASLGGLVSGAALAAGPIPGGAAGGWGTPPFVPAGGGGWRGWLAGLAGGWREFLGIGGSVQLGPGMATTWQAATFWQKLTAIGRSPAAALAGGLLAIAGLQRGGWSGLGMSTAGGALLGFKFGGPLGAAIGAAGGFVAGLIGLFRKSAEEKAREKIRATYGVDIRDKGVLRQIVEMAKQAFGGNLDAAIRSQQVRDLIELYAMTTGQSTAGLPPTVRPVSLIQQGGMLYQQTFTAGATATLDRIAAGAPAAGPIVINISVPGAKEFFEKETVRVVVDNPRAVQSATLSATRANAGRRELAALQFSPGLVMT